MTETKWYLNTKTGEISDYQIYGETGEKTNFPRGLLLAYNDYLIVGFKTKDEAETWGKKWSACLKCKSARKGKHNEICSLCGTYLVSSYKEKKYN